MFKMDGDPHYRDVETCTYHVVPRMGDLVTRNSHLFIVDRVVITDYVDENDRWACIIYASQT